MSRCWTRLAFSMSLRSSCCGVVTVLTDPGTVTRGDEISLWDGKSETSALDERRITMGMSGLGVTPRIFSDRSRDVIVTSEVDVELPAVGFETLSGELVIRSGNQRAATKERRNKTIVPTIHTLASAIIGTGDILRPESLVLRPGRECIRAPNSR